MREAVPEPCVPLIHHSSARCQAVFPEPHLKNPVQNLRFPERPVDKNAFMVNLVVQSATGVVVPGKISRQRAVGRHHTAGDFAQNDLHELRMVRRRLFGVELSHFPPGRNRQHHVPFQRNGIHGLDFIRFAVRRSVRVENRRKIRRGLRR